MQRETSLTFEQVQEMMANVVTQTIEKMGEKNLEMVRELKKPTEQEQEKIDKETALSERKRNMMVLRGKEDEDKRYLRSERCSHLKPNGKIAIGGLITGDGMIHPICFKCQTEFEAIKPTPQMIQGGVNLMSRVGLTPQDFKVKQPRPRPNPDLSKIAEEVSA